jgi:hypothetical protein
MTRVKPQRPVPFIAMTEMEGGVTHQRQRPQLRAHWQNLNG